MDLSLQIEQESPGRRLIRALCAQDLHELQALVSADVAVLDYKDSNGDSILHIAVRKQNVEILEYILNQERIDLNSLDSLGRTPLLTTIVNTNLAVLKLLIQKGVDLNFPDFEGNTPLHYAAYFKLLENCKLLLDSGADINARNSHGLTILHVVCDVHTELELLALLVCYGANCSMVSNSQTLGYTAFERTVVRNKVRFQEFLMDFVFDGEKIPIMLGAFVGAMKHNPQLFDKLVENVSTVLYDVAELAQFLNDIPYYNTECFKFFLETFTYVIKDIRYIHSMIVGGLFKYVSSGENEPTLLQNLYLIFSEPYAPYFVENVNAPRAQNILLPLIAQHVLHRNHQFPPDMFTKIVLHILSRGVHVTDQVLDQIYYTSGDCETFRLLLHMDVQRVIASSDRSPFPAIIYDTDLRKIEDLFSEKIVSDRCLTHMFGFFAGFAFKKWAGRKEKFQDRAEMVPNLSSLLELARNAARNHIINHYRVTCSRQLYTVIQCLPIINEYKAILAFQKKIYRLC